VTSSSSTTARGRATARRPLLDNSQDVLLFGAIVLAGGVFFGVYLIGQLAGLLGRFTWPHGDLGASFTVLARLPRHWSDPRVAYPVAAQKDLPALPGFILATVLLLALAFAGTVLLVRLRGRSRPVQGYATLKDLDKALSIRAVMARGSSARPSLAGTKYQLCDVGVELGESVFHKRRLAISVESSVLLIASPRQGKTSMVIIPWLSTWPGPALVTSVRADVLAATHQIRAQRGPVLVMDPTGEVNWPDMVAWSPTAGCQDYKVALDRAEVLVTVGKTDHQDSGNAQFFGMSATNLLAAWLHAAALGGLTMAEVLRWAFNDNLTDSVRILRQHADRGAAKQVVDMLSRPADQGQPLGHCADRPCAAADRRRAQHLQPRPRQEPGDRAVPRLRWHHLPAQLGDLAGRLAPLIAAFVDEVILTARRLAARQPRQRLDPPLGIFPDEIANVVPLPNLPALMSYAAGSGIFVVPVFQSFAQAASRWGQHGAEMIWGSATVKIALAGLAGEELEMLSKLAGTYREQLTSSQSGVSGSSLSTTLTDRPTAPADEIRTLQPGEAFVVEAATPPVKVRMTRHFEGPRAHEHRRSEEEFTYLTGLRPPEPADKQEHGDLTGARR
jgi:type IV secretion system protein VirD4